LVILVSTKKLIDSNICFYQYQMDLNQLSYKELQQLSKENGLIANLKKSELINALTEFNKENPKIGKLTKEQRRVIQIKNRDNKMVGCECGSFNIRRGDLKEHQKSKEHFEKLYNRKEPDTEAPWVEKANAQLNVDV
jgi:hypothetical protein